MQTETTKIDNPNFLRGFDKIIAKDSLRPTMCGVYFDGCYAVATDAHKLVKLDLRLYGIDEEDAEVLDGYFADADALKEIKLTKGQHLTLSKGAINVHNKSRKIKTVHLQLMESVGKYPNYDAAIPQDSTPTEFINFDASKLQDVQDVYRLINGGATDTRGLGLRMRFNGSNRGIVVMDQTEQFTGLVMPLKLQF